MQRKYLDAINFIIYNYSGIEELSAHQTIQLESAWQSYQNIKLPSAYPSIYICSYKSFNTARYRIRYDESRQIHVIEKSGPPWTEPYEVLNFMYEIDSMEEILDDNDRYTVLMAYFPNIFSWYDLSNITTSDVDLYVKKNLSKISQKRRW